MRERKYSSGCQCGICPSQTDKLCAQQTASLLSEKPGGFFDSLRPPEKAVSFYGNPRTSFLQTNTPYPASIPSPFRQGRVWEVRTAGRCRHRPLRNSIENPCVGADSYIGPVAPIFKSCVGRRALTPPRWRSGYRTAGWGQPALQCLAPLPKGGLGGRIATASVPTDLAMTGFHGVWCMAGGRPQGPPLPPIFPLYTFLPPGFLTSLTMISAPHAADLDTLLIFNIF